MEKKYDFTIGLLGNPSVGKTSLFSALTGVSQQVGKTVEKREGEFVFEGQRVKIVDLPGSYSLNAYTEDEMVTSAFILQKRPDAVLQIIDARNLKRNLFMTVHLIEMGAPLMVAINLLDLAQEKGITIDIQKLSMLLDVPVVAINVKQGRGIEELSKTVLSRKAYRKHPEKKMHYGIELEEELEKIRKILWRDATIAQDRLDWLSVSFLEGSNTAKKFLENKIYYEELEQIRLKSVSHLEGVFGKDLDTIFARIRYGFIDGLARECIERKTPKPKNRWYEKVDEIALSRFLGLPLLFVVMLAVFQSAFRLSSPISDMIRMLFGYAGEISTSVLYAWGFSAWTVSLVVDGIIGGVGNVLVFVPILGMLFLLLAILEDSGYMARIAYVMDRFMHALGLHGKAFVPMILGFGCNVPGILATRTLETRRDRILAILINPFMSCGSRLPTYILFAGIFFPRHQGIVIFSLYAFGVMMAIAVGMIFRRFIFKELSSPFVIELPAYSFPNLKGVFVHAGEKVWLFIKNAGTLILAFSVLIWFMANLPLGVAYGSESSLAGMFGKTLSPLFAPLGFGNWQSAVALTFGLAGKEIIVGTFGTLYGGSQSSALSLASSLQNDFTPLSAYAFMIFVLLYTPCIATLAAIRKETSSWKWTIFVALYSVVIAWLAAFAVYHGGKLLLGF